MPTKKTPGQTDEKPSVVPFENEHHKKTATPKVKSATNQNVNQNHLTEQGNETKGNTPGGNFNEVRHTQANKPRSNPQGNAPMSIDSTNAKKGPGRKAD
ncbi:hypothetical protein AUC43_01770 [Hymenobacter sedentarius]|uniref:Uncharacterized protein n=1 Tax=Hymenobacter sedentarius TaxID=1411621 RepID=A0A0U3STR2_9BACT|nr:hypothetical protein [Hymenobacter sedentarius]ALW83939.1 hypothetical protein AUC43_01770 [Hymenobacter sedentarius]